MLISDTFIQRLLSFCPHLCPINIPVCVGETSVGSFIAPLKIYIKNTKVSNKHTQ